MPLFVIPFPPIGPTLVEFGPFAIRWYALSYIAAIFFGWWYAKRLVASRRIWGPAGAPMQPVAIDDFVIWATVGIIAGGRLGYVLVYDLWEYVSNPLEILALWHGGMSFHGGFLGTILAMVLFARARKIPVWSLIDVIAASVPPGIVFVRLANFVNGELFGRPADVPWAMVFPNGGPEPRHPSQLYEALLEGVVLFIVLRLLTHRFGKLRQPGVVSGVFATGYGLARIVSEFFREPDVQMGYYAGGLTMGMILSIPMVLFGIGLTVWALRRPPAVPAQDPA
jgi:phosphatidylglycerol:prolipoprotein diacylglycerol transferase